MKRIAKLTTAAAVGLLGTTVVASAQTKTLDTVKQRGSLSCGVNIGLAGFSQPDDKGNWTGLDVDYCKAIAAAVLGDANKVKYVPTTAKERFTALQSGEIDVLSRNTTWTHGARQLARPDLRGRQLLRRPGLHGEEASLGVKSRQGAQRRHRLRADRHHHRAQPRRLLPANKMTYKPVVFEKLDETMQAYLAGRCDVYTTDQSGLYSIRVQQPKPDDHVVLPEIISKEPLGTVRAPGRRPVADGRQVGALRAAQRRGARHHPGQRRRDAELRPTPRSSASSARTASSARASASTTTGSSTIVKAVGNYGELFERNVGTGSRLKIARGLNNLWSKGGIQYAPPLR